MAASDTQYITNVNISGINLYTNPLFNLNGQDGEVIRAVNVDSYPLGAKMKRPGYTSFLNNPDNAQVNSCFSWTQDNGTSIWLYRFSGSQLYYYDEGQATGTAWNVCGNGTFTGTHVGFAVLGNTMICGDGVGSTRHTTNGTSFTNTTLAPAGEHFEQYQNRIYIGGTSSTLFFSDTGDATNWSIGGTSDSSSLTIPGAGIINKVYKIGDLLHISKTGKNIFQWDGNSLIDTATTLGMSSPYSYAKVEDSGLFINQGGVYLSDVSGPQLISNPVTRYFYNEAMTGIAGTAFGSAPAVVNKYDYYVAVGSTQDDFTTEGLNNGIIKYNYQKNEFLTYQFNDAPTAFGTYIDNTGIRQMFFGNSAGQCFTYGGTVTSDNGVTINCVIDMVFNFNAPYFDKEWRWFFGYFNPGCEAQVSVACTDTFVRQQKTWIELGDATNGIIRYRFPTGLRSRLLYLRIKEASKTSRFEWYGATIGAKLLDPDA